MADNDEKIIKLLEQQGKAIESINKRLDGVEQNMTTKSDLAHTDTTVEAVNAGVNDIRDKMATKADLIDLGAKIDKVARNHETRIKEIEEDHGVTHRNKN